MGKTIAQALIEEGMEKGIIQTKQEDLVELIRFRFRDVKPETNSKIHSIQDVDKLTTLFRCALSANSINEIGIE